MSAPERIWIYDDHRDGWQVVTDTSYADTTEYVRADLAHAVPDGWAELIGKVIDALHDERASQRHRVELACKLEVQLLAAAPKPPQREADEWRPISEAPKDGRMLLGGWWNEYGKWRTVRMFYAQPNTLDADPDSDDEFAPEGWYADTENEFDVHAVEPAMWHAMPLPPPPKTTGEPT